jgi:ABC-2 type transport system ATP-binding protein
VPRKRDRGTPAPPAAPIPRPEDEAGGAPPPPIVTRGLTKRYGELTAVDALDLDLMPGEIFGLLGQNGAGKTTTILMLLGLTEPTRGWARVAGFDPTRQPLEVKRRVGYLPDAVGFYGAMSGRSNLRYTARLNRIDRVDAEARIEAVLEQVGMAGRADDRVETYSRGMLQRLGIADALLKEPAVLILDEPTTAIDPIGVVEILELLRRLARERGIAILLSSHLLSQVQSVCDRVGIFAAGRLIGLGTVPELASAFGGNRGLVEVRFEGRTDDARIAAALGSIPQVEKLEPAPGEVGTWNLVVNPVTADRTVREAVLKAAAEQQLGLTAIRSVTASLEDIYRTALHQEGLAA